MILQGFGNSFESFVEGLEIPKLDKEVNESLEQELTVEELKKALHCKRVF